MRNKLSIEDIKSVICDKEFIQVENSTMTICILTLKNGCRITGTSACIAKETFIQSVGEEIAEMNAIEKIWQLEGYLLMQKLYEESLK